MAIFNEAYILEFFGKKKDKKNNENPNIHKININDKDRTIHVEKGLLDAVSYDDIVKDVRTIISQEKQLIKK